MEQQPKEKKKTRERDEYERGLKKDLQAIATHRSLSVTPKYKKQPLIALNSQIYIYTSPRASCSRCTFIHLVQPVAR